MAGGTVFCSCIDGSGDPDSERGGLRWLVPSYWWLRQEIS